MQMRKIRDQSEKKLLGDQAIGGKRQQAWPINTRGIFQEKSGGHHLIKKT